MDLYVVSWPMLVLALVVFGFAPGLLLRLIVLAFPRDDPRRRELRGELYGVPRWERPFWVAEQLEVALVEGLGHRLARAAEGRIINRWHLGSGVERNQRYPDTFWIPSGEELKAIVPGVDVRLMFETDSGPDVRMWVTVIHVRRRKLVGKLVSAPALVPRLMLGDKVKFKREHIIDTWHWHEDDLEAWELAGYPPDPAVLVSEERERCDNYPCVLD